MPRPDPPTADPGLTDTEALLAALAPAPAAVSRDRILYEAGRRAAPRDRRPWGVAAAAVALSAGLVARDALRPEAPPRVVERIVYVRAAGEAPAAPAPPTADPAPAGDYLRLRDQALRFGVEILPTPAGDWDEPAPAGSAFAQSRGPLLLTTP